MADPNLFKRCGCRHPDTGKPLTACPKLRRRGGAWNPDHGVWHYQIELPRKANGDRRQLRRGGFAHNKAAAAERDRARALLALAAGDPDIACEIADLLQAATKRGGPLPDPDTLRARLGGHLPVTDNPTVAAYLTGWLAARKLDENTLRGYESHIRVHLIPHLGRHRLTKLRARHIAALFDAIEARNEQIHAAKTSDDPTVRKTVGGVRPTGPVTCQRIRDTLRNALNDAVPTLIPTNPAVEVELAPARPAKARPWTAERVARWQATGQKPSPVMFWLPQQTIEFLDYAAEHDPELYPLYRLIAYRGLRRGEACGLLDADATLDTPTGRGHLTTTNQTATLGHKTKQKKPKSEAGDRTVPLDAGTTTVLRDYRTQRRTRQQETGADWPNHGLFFTKPDGQPWHPNLVSARFRRLTAKAGLPPIRVHDLRHGAATLARAAGSDAKIVQATLGHSSLAATEIYDHVLPDILAESADAVAAFLDAVRRAA